MTCHNCSAICKKFGKFGPKRIQRWRCSQCKKTFSESQDKPLDDMRIPLERAEMCLQLLLEGMSMRSIQRVTGLHQETILNLLTLAGERCEKLMRERIKGVAVKDVEADEIWGFVGCKNRHKLNKGITDPHVGDAYTFVGIERNTKLVLAWHLGERGMEDTEAFTEKLSDATSGRFQLTTDGFRPYENAVSYSLGTRVDFAQLIKVYASNREAEQKYSPLEVVETITKIQIGLGGHPKPANDGHLKTGQ
jgi:transposase-like protein/IS1 family transposase